MNDLEDESEEARMERWVKDCQGGDERALDEVTDEVFRDGGAIDDDDFCDR